MKDEQILTEYLAYLRQRYRSKHTRANNLSYAKGFLRWLKSERHKDLEELTGEDTKEYKAFCFDNYKQNGNVGRINGINRFCVDFLNKPDCKITAPKSVQVNKPVLDEEEIDKYIEAATTALEKLIVFYQIDGLLRPGEFGKLCISKHDIDKQILYIDDTKTGNNSIILTPRMIKAFSEYMRVRTPPKEPRYKDQLIIIPKGSHIGQPIGEKSDYVYRQTKKIAARAGFKRAVYPYLVKPSAITDSFNRAVNPKIIQRQARHKQIETTLRYDHAEDKMVREHFNREQTHQIQAASPEEKARVWMDKLLSGEIDLKTFKTGIDVLLPKTRQEGDLDGYV